ncbi:hypothetical protein PHISCL_07503 [Aspergillus sclerotialis]|uniref:NAD/NADP octopine/nopaline dehydrogenase n=1 Tax=Aspergillus sclerotialis TaxID=2070753 RepID=A0A3A2ZFP1_9EURO|nr:hypothetical protein PHISCL_07503 [Aspergillus sclerotialis]
MSPEHLNEVASITLVGAGPCGCSFAADLASQGKSVMLYAHPEHRGALPMIEENGGYLDASGQVNGRFKIQTTSDMGVALKHSRFIVTTVPSYGQNSILQELHPFDLRNHILIVNVGNFFFLSARQATNAKAVLETNISPYATRIENGIVLVKGIKESLSIWAAPPTSRSNRPTLQEELTLKEQVESIFSPRLEWCQSLIQVGLTNINPVCHSPAVLMNTGWIESTKGDFYFYHQGMSPSVAKVSERLDEERLAIGRAYGFDLLSITGYMNQNYRAQYRNYRDFAQGSPIHNKTKGAPQSMKHRYLLEDIGHCIVPWYELGLKAGLSSPTIKAIIDLASIVSDFDYLSHRRALKAAGLSEASKEEISLVLGGTIEDDPRVLAPLSDNYANINGLKTGPPIKATQVAA